MSESDGIKELNEYYDKICSSIEMNPLNKFLDICLRKYIDKNEIGIVQKKIELHRVCGEMYENSLNYDAAVEEYMNAYKTTHDYFDSYSGFEYQKMYYTAFFQYKIGLTYRYLGDMRRYYEHMLSGMEQYEKYSSFLDYMDLILENDEKKIDNDYLNACIEALVNHAAIANNLACFFRINYPDDKFNIKKYYKIVINDVKYSELIMNSLADNENKISRSISFSECFNELSYACYWYGIVFKDTDFIERSYKSSLVALSLMPKKKVKINRFMYNKCLRVSSNIFKNIGNIKYYFEKSYSEARILYEQAIEKYSEIEGRIGSKEIFLAETFIDYKKMFHENKYDEQLAGILNSHQDIPVFKELRKH